MALMNTVTDTEVREVLRHLYTGEVLPFPPFHLLASCDPLNKNMKLYKKKLTLSFINF